MSTRLEAPFVRTDIWREGEWLDLWSVVHFLSGMSVGFGFYFLQFDARASVLLALVSFSAYEMWEALAKIEETPANRFMDIVVGMVSFLPTYFLLAPSLSKTEFIPVFGFVFITNIAMAALGWRASQKAAVLKESLRKKYAVQRALLLKREARLRKRFQHPK